MTLLVRCYVKCRVCWQVLVGVPWGCPGLCCFENPLHPLHMLRYKDAASPPDNEHCNL